MIIFRWLSNNYIEIFGAITGILYVFLEIRQTIWLWPVGIITSAVYIWVFFTSKLYADMSLQAYYLLISILGWYWWLNKGAKVKKKAREPEQRVTGRKGEGENGTQSVIDSTNELPVTRLKRKTGAVLSGVFILLFIIMWLILDRFTDSPVPEWDSFLTSLSIIATWMLARKIYEHWFIWIVVDILSMVLYVIRELYPTVALFLVYSTMAFIGLIKWKQTIQENDAFQS